MKEAITPKNIFLDGLSSNKAQRRIDFYDFQLAQYIRRRKNKSTIFLKQGITERFPVREKKFNPVFSVHRLDGLSRQAYIQKQEYHLGTPTLDLEKIKARYSSTKNYLLDLTKGSVENLSVVKMWNMSLAGSIIFGMLTMTMIYRYLGGSALAENKNGVPVVQAPQTNGQTLSEAQDEVASEADPEFLAQLFKDYYQSEKDDQKAQFAERVRAMVKGYPIESMVPDILKQDQIVAALIIAIGKKESDWGKHVPVLNGSDCYNYWGFRAQREKMGTGGHTCFDSRQDAVESVAKRIKFLVSNERLNTPKKMVVWKCGYDCSWDSVKEVNKWISDVDMYFQKLNDVGDLTFSLK